MATCYLHPGVETGVSCSGCGRPICPDCMTASPVGMRCPDCSGASGRSSTQKVLGLPAASGRPVLTISLIAACALLFLFSGVALGGGNQLFRLLALSAPPVAEGQLFRLLSYGFLHGSILHIFFNMLILWFLGSQMEEEVGPLKFAAVYFTSLVFAALGALLLTPFALTVGASGAVYGLMGAFVVLMFSRGINPFKTGLGTLLILNLLLSFVLPGVSIGGHLGGLLGGAFIGGLLVLSSRRGRGWILPAGSLLLGFSAAALCLLVALAAV